MRTWLRYALEITKTYPEKYGRGVSAREKKYQCSHRNH